MSNVWFDQECRVKRRFTIESVVSGQAAHACKLLKKEFKTLKSLRKHTWHGGAAPNRHAGNTPAGPPGHAAPPNILTAWQLPLRRILWSQLRAVMECGARIEWAMYDLTRSVNCLWMHCFWHRLFPRTHLFDRVHHVNCGKPVPCVSLGHKRKGQGEFFSKLKQLFTHVNGFTPQVPRTFFDLSRTFLRCTCTWRTFLTCQERSSTSRTFFKCKGSAIQEGSCNSRTFLTNQERSSDALLQGITLHVSKAFLNCTNVLAVQEGWNLTNVLEVSRSFVARKERSDEVDQIWSTPQERSSIARAFLAHQERSSVVKAKMGLHMTNGIRTMTLSKTFPFISHKSHAEKSERISALKNIKSYYKSLMKTLFIEKYNSFITQGNNFSRNNNTYSLMRTMIN